MALPLVLVAIHLCCAAPAAEAQDPARQGLVERVSALRELEQRNDELRAEIVLAGAWDGAEIARRAEDAAARAERLREDLDRLRTSATAGGMRDAAGVLLSGLLRQLPPRRELARAARPRQRELAARELRRAEIVEELDLLATPGREARRYRGLAAGEASAEELPRVEDRALDLLLQRRTLLLELRVLHEEALGILHAWDAHERAYADLVAEARAFASDRLLWVRTRPGGALPSPATAARALGWLFGPEAWSAGLAGIADARREFVSRALPLTLASIVLLLLAPRLRRYARTSSGKVRSFRSDRLRLSFLVLGADLVRSAAWPALLVALAVTLNAPPDQPEAVRSVAAGMLRAAPVLWALAFLRATCAPHGLGAEHLRWSKKGLARLRRTTAWFLPLATVCMLLVGATERRSIAGYHESLGLLAFGVLVSALAVAMLQAFRPQQAPVSAMLKTHPDGWLARTRALWVPLRVLLPLGILALSWAGWEHTADVLLGSFVGTLGLALAVALASGLLHRWRRVERRRIKVAEARRRHEAQAVQPGEGGEPAELDEDAVDVPAVDGQTRKLIRSLTVLATLVGLYAIWTPSLPVLGVLDRVQLWPRIGITPAVQEAPAASATEAEDAAASAEEAGAEAAAGDSAVIPLPRRPAAAAAPAAEQTAAGTVSLQDVVLGILILVATWIVVRNVTGVVEILLARRSALNAANRFAMATVLRYVLTLLGIGYGFLAVGIAWSQVQWLVAALTFGLAFGLQEIFANFVSGLIILFERPVRIGDTVTVGGVSGEITRIRMRATVITDWDRKELVVPNKSFITDQVVNWSLSDAILRVTVPVGVSYSSDAQKVRRTLLRVAQATPVVLEDPAPNALFLGFGDSTLNFELRCFIPGVEDLVATRDRLHHGILAAFREEDIEIAFPQRDLHLRSAGARVEVVTRAAPHGEGRPLGGDGGGTPGGAPGGA